MTVFVNMKIYTPEENKIDSDAAFSYFLNLQHISLLNNALRSQDSFLQKQFVFKLVKIDTVLGPILFPSFKVIRKRIE